MSYNSKTYYLINAIFTRPNAQKFHTHQSNDSMQGNGQFSSAILDDQVGVVLRHLGGKIKKSLRIRDSFIMVNSRYKATVFNSNFS